MRRTNEGAETAMNVRELIEYLNDIENKSQQVEVCLFAGVVAFRGITTHVIPEDDSLIARSNESNETVTKIVGELVAR